MKSINNFGKAVLIWLGTLLFSSVLISLISGESRMILSFGFFSVFFSAPAFIMFAIGYYYINKQDWSSRKKRGYALLVNYTDIALTFLTLFLLTGDGDKAGDVFLPYIGLLVAASTLIILLIPFPPKTNNALHSGL